MTGLEPLLVSAGVGAGTASTVATIGTTLGALGAVGGAVSSYQAGKAQAKIAGQKQQQLQASADLQASQQAKLNKQLRSKQLAQISKAGIELSGGALNLATQTAAEQEIDILTQKYNTQLGLNDLAQQGNIAEFEGKTNAAQQLLKLPTILGS